LSLPVHGLGVGATAAALALPPGRSGREAACARGTSGAMMQMTVSRPPCGRVPYPIEVA
jgi:hypothetical protein